jgi:HlyD family secretion protein
MTTPPIAPVEPTPTPPTPAAVPAPAREWWKKPVTWLIAGVLASSLAIFAWRQTRPSGPGPGFVSGNGRIEATEINIATRLPGRVESISVSEGDAVALGQILAHMQVDVLDAQRAEAQAQSQQASTAVTSAEAQVAARKSETAAAEAAVNQRSSDLHAAQNRFSRIETLFKDGVATDQELDDSRASFHGAQAAVVAAQAQVDAAQAATRAAQAQVAGARSGVVASDATIARIEADLADSQLKSPIDGRVQFRIAQPGEVLGAGGKVMNLVDLSETHLTFFLPETVVGRIALGSEVRLILDAAPEYVIPASISYVASVAQFTPKTVETVSERQKLMFRVKAQISRDLLQKHLKTVKTGLPGVAWLKLDAKENWPPHLDIQLPE